jgi:hypothetical protein
MSTSITREEKLRCVNCFNDFMIEKLAQLEELAKTFEVNFKIECWVTSHEHNLTINTQHSYNHLVEVAKLQKPIRII